MSNKSLYQSNLKRFHLKNRGKVRDLYTIDEKHLLMIATDRLSVFDVVLPQPIPGKGAVLTSVSQFWFDRTEGMVANHLSEIHVSDILNQAELDEVGARAMVIKSLRPLPIEAIVRGYLIGSGWKDYQKTQSVCGIQLPKGLREADALSEPIFTPSTKAEQGLHDENISYQEMVNLIGADLASEVKHVSIELYKAAVTYAQSRGIIIADTKFEFGLDEYDKLILIDEVLTPDSSRFWPLNAYQVGISPPSYDKQYVRDYMETLGWDKKPPAPSLPEDVITKTADKYQQAKATLLATV